MISVVNSPSDEQELAGYEVHFTAGQVIFSEGDPSTHAYLLKEGRIRIVKRIGAIERSLRIVRPGELFGQTALVSGALRNATGISLAPGRALGFSRSEFESLLARHPEVGVTVCEQLVLRAKRAEDRIEVSMVRDSQARVVLGLLRSAQLVTLQRADAGNSVRLQLSPLDLSALVGLDVNAVKRAVERLRDNDYVRIVDEQVEIPDVEALSELHGLLQARDEIIGGDG
jgi:CRP-like cAMP-binding protein